MPSAAHAPRTDQPASIFTALQRRPPPLPDQIRKDLHLGLWRIPAPDEQGLHRSEVALELVLRKPRAFGIGVQHCRRNERDTHARHATPKDGVVRPKLNDPTRCHVVPCTPGLQSLAMRTVRFKDQQRAFSNVMGRSDRRMPGRSDDNQLLRVRHQAVQLRVGHGFCHQRRVQLARKHARRQRARRACPKFDADGCGSLPSAAGRRCSRCRTQCQRCRTWRP